VHRIGEEAGEPEADEIYEEQSNYEGLCNNVELRRLQNMERVRIVVESNNHIKEAIKKIAPIVKQLKKVKTKTKKEE
jgi:hypothetical protein